MLQIPFFSIVTPLLDGAHHISGYVQTLLSQSCGNWEAIIVDDGSTDGGQELLAAFAAADPRFRVLKNPFKKEIAGPYMARNIGIESANGAYICFLDIDDRWFSCKLALQEQALRENANLNLLYSAYYRAPLGDLSQACARFPPPPSLAKHCVKIANPVPMLTACVRRSALKGIRFQPLNHEDYIFWYEVVAAFRSSEIFCEYRPLAIYSVEPSSLSGNKFRAARWIWLCYRSFGYSFLKSSVAWCARGLLQAFWGVSDAFSKYRVPK